MLIDVIFFHIGQSDGVIGHTGSCKKIPTGKYVVIMINAIAFLKSAFIVGIMFATSTVCASNANIPVRFFLWVGEEGGGGGILPP